MILPFKTNWPAHMGDMASQPTYFIQKIWEGFFFHEILPTDDLEVLQLKFIKDHRSKFGQSWDLIPDDSSRLKYPKIHTIREDGNGRWKSGVNIDYFINSRTKNMFRFAPNIPCVSTQQLYMLKEPMGLDENDNVNEWGVFFKIDDRVLDYNEAEELALNDGFDSLEAFCQYFDPILEPTKQKSLTLIHWTKFRY
ncbi:hypothetical protein ABDK00_016990 [Niabella insulamsoli]|uniref:hypothetical protein n=1 Tax=Niabella insulamsoli TaxID=3144874 RepID=UPI0031FCEFD3